MLFVYLHIEKFKLMETVFTLLMVLIIIACVLLVIVIMAQNPKGGGLSSTFGGTSAASFGVQRTNDFMDKATWGLGIFITVLIIMSAVLTADPASVHKPAKATAPQPTVPQNNPASNASEAAKLPETPAETK